LRPSSCTRSSSTSPTPTSSTRKVSISSWP
jgi:hypothetical protein